MSKPIMGTTAGATQLRLKFSNTGSGQLVDGSASSSVNSDGTRYVDVARLLSQANHRLYRQGRMYMIRVGFHQPGHNVGATVSALPNTWMTRKAWKSGRDAYLKAMRDSGVKLRGRWNDFRVNFDQAQYNGAGTVPYTFVTLGGASITGIDTRLTQIAGDSGSSEGSSAGVYQFHFNGDTTFNDRDGATGSFGLINEYDKEQDTEEDQPQHSGLQGSFDELNLDSQMAQANRELSVETGDNPPYDPDTLENARTVDYAMIQQAEDSVGPVTPWIAAPAGLLKITSLGSDALGSNDMYVEVMSGTYKGVMSEPM